jgi:hypothetical protein
VKKTYTEILRQRKQRIQNRLDPKRRLCDQGAPVIGAGNLRYEMSDKVRAINCGGLGAIDLLVEKVGLRERIDARLHLLKRHVPYHESDHVLNLAYNALLGGIRLEDIELRRNDEAFLDALGAPRIPDPTTSGDFTRRFQETDILELLEAINATRQEVWKKQPEGFLAEAILDVDGTIAGTYGECKGGMSLSYKGIWGYAPLIISLANTREVLCLVNRPGNEPSHEGCVPWLDLALEVVRPFAGKITLRGDTDFTCTAELDRWDAEGIQFVFGLDAHAKARNLAESLPAQCWKTLERLPRYAIATEPRQRPARVKEEIVRLKGYENKVLQAESVAETEYRPTNCERSYRLVIVRKNLSVQRGEEALFDEIRYFFYLTNRRADGLEEIVGLANGRGDQENVIEQLKNGINAMRMPVDNLVSNWAYMVMSTLAWNLKAWFGLLLPDRERGLEIVAMEFRRFLHALILLPTQIVRAGRQIIYRILSYNEWVKDLFAAWKRLRRFSTA